MTLIPRSDVMGAWTPNLEIQPATKASVQAVAVVEVKGTYHLHPPGCSINDGHHMRVAVRAGRYWADQINMYVCETTGGDEDGLEVQLAVL